MPLYLFAFIMITGATFNLHAQMKSEYTNPILAGFYPDPSICRVDDDYYLVNSTFAYYPGIPVFHSKDLVNWKLSGYVIDRPDELNYDSLGVSRGIFAPAIRYHDGLFYVTCTFVDGGGNFVCTAKNPAGPWSKPVWLPQVSGIDPSLFFDDNGKAYLVFNSIAPDNKPLYQGHRTIRIREFDYVGLHVLDEEKIIVNGGTNIKNKPVWIEGPHVFKVRDRYYLIAAEGGTAENHSEVVFRSENIDGPYVPYEDNPILTQRDLNPDRKNPVTCTGHADLVETQASTWWAVFLGCRPYADDSYNTGRETFLAPVTWKNDWPIILPHGDAVKYFYQRPLPPVSSDEQSSYSGNFKFRDDFDSDSLNLVWEFLRAPIENWYNLRDRKGYLTLQLRPETCSGKNNPSFIAHRQEHMASTASTAFQFLPKAENKKAGLIIFQNESHFYFLCKSLEEGKPAVQLYRSIDSDSSKTEMELIASRELSPDRRNSELNLEIVAKGAYYSFSYGFKNDRWISLGDSVDAAFLSTKTAGGFVGCMFGLYATSMGKLSGNKAEFDWFRYIGNDSVYSKGTDEK